MEHAKIQAPTRLIARVIRDLVARESFDCMTDLKDVLWRRLHHFRIPATAGAVDEALSMVGSNVALTRRREG